MDGRASGDIRAKSIVALDLLGSKVVAEHQYRGDCAN